MAHVLLIEPDRLLARTYTAALEYAGYAVHSATTAQAAIDKADEQMPDVIILELQLSVHNGIEFLYELRSYPEWQEVPVIINSAIPPQALAEVQHTLTEQLGVHVMHYKPKTTLQTLLRTVIELTTGAV